MNSLLLRRLLFWGAMAFAFTMAILPQPPDLPGEPDDKIQHIMAFATLAVLGAWAYLDASLWLMLGGLSAFGALIEVVQGIPFIHRDSDIKDWIADTIAAAAVLLAVGLWRRQRARGREAP